MRRNPGRFENDCILILSHLAEFGYTSLDDLSNSTGVTRDECRRYLLEKVWMVKNVDELEVWKNKNKKLFAKAIETCVYVGDGKFKMNTSKRDYLEKYAFKYGFFLKPTEKYPYVFVEKVPINEFVSHLKDVNLSDEKPRSGEIVNEKASGWSPLA